MGSRSSVLTIESIRGHHAGNYSCFGQNIAGISNHSVPLIVNGSNDELFYLKFKLFLLLFLICLIFVFISLFFYLILLFIPSSQSSFTLEFSLLTRLLTDSLNLNFNYFPNVKIFQKNRNEKLA